MGKQKGRGKGQGKKVLSAQFGGQGVKGSRGQGVKGVKGQGSQEAAKRPGLRQSSGAFEGSRACNDHRPREERGHFVRILNHPDAKHPTPTVRPHILRASPAPPRSGTCQVPAPESAPTPPLSPALRVSSLEAILRRSGRSLSRLKAKHQQTKQPRPFYTLPVNPAILLIL